MNSINLVALPKKFSFMRWRLFGYFCQNTYIYIYTYFMCIFTVQGVLKNRQCRDMGLKLKYMISMITLGNKLAVAWDISTDSTLLRVTDTWMKILFAQSGLVFPQFWVFAAIFDDFWKIFINFFTPFVTFIVLNTTVLISRFQRKNRFEKRTTLGRDIYKNVF